jgi:hypothetical protein
LRVIADAALLRRILARDEMPGGRGHTGPLQMKRMPHRL